VSLNATFARAPVRFVPRTIAAGGILLALLLPAAVLVLLAVELRGATYIAFDRQILEFVERHGETLRLSFVTDSLATTLGLLGLLAAAGFFVVLVVRRNFDQALFFSMSMVGAVTLSRLLKDVFHRVPLSGSHDGYSFPSGNAMGSLALVVALLVVLWPSRWRWPVLVLGIPAVLFYGLALVYIGWHYPTDVLAGWCAGLSWVVLTFLVLPPRRSSSRLSSEAARGRSLG